LSVRPNDKETKRLRMQLSQSLFTSGRPKVVRGWGDMAIVVAGLALAVGCALFPWYVFFNQEQFGIRAMNFSGNDAANIMPSDLAYQPELVRRKLNPGEIPLLSLDLLSTGTLPGRDDPANRGVPVDDQPFPGEEASAFALVHVADGRAMIEDEYGLWIVQPGSLLPDQSRVASIEERDGEWVIVTDKNRVISMAK